MPLSGSRPFLRLLLATFAAVAFLAGCTDPAATGDSQTVIYLVRHAEKQTGDDPSLTAAGRERAELLADRLSDAGIQYVYTTDYARTRETAQPLADRLGLTLRLYDPRDLEGLAETLRSQRGGHLVVGHSNTTPDLVAALGGDPGGPIEEAGEYDRLYRIEIAPGGDVSSELQRYGVRYSGAQ